MAIGNSQNLYISIWMSQVDIIVKHILENDTAPHQLNLQDFEEAGNRKCYNFSVIRFNNRRCDNCPNSAVARDLVDVLERSYKFCEASKGKIVKIRFNKSCSLKIEVDSLEVAKSKDS